MFFLCFLLIEKDSRSFIKSSFQEKHFQTIGSKRVRKLKKVNKITVLEHFQKLNDFCSQVFEYKKKTSNMDHK